MNLAKLVIMIAMPLAITQNWAAARFRDDRWYSALALLLWVVTRMPSLALYHLAVRLNK